MNSSRFSVYRVISGTLLALAFLASQAVFATTSRVALVIGNADYSSSSVQSLKNPVSDARGISEALKNLKFQVLSLENANQATMENAFRAFGQKLKADAKTHDDVVALFYYSGHGAQVNGKNYLLSVSSDTNYDMTDAKKRSGVVPLTKLFHALNVAGKTTNIVILDACRDNPPTKDVANKNTKSAVIKGLEWLDEKETAGGTDNSDPSNTIFAYATARGKVAEDGYGVNSPYTQHLLKLIGQRGLSAYELFQQVGKLVERDTYSKQQPWQYSSLLKDFYFKPRITRLRSGGFR
jgi:uncharacterized caspase-like protein